MLKLNKTALADALSALDKNNMVKPYLTANNISVVSNLRTLTVHALSDAEAQGLDLVPLSNFYNAYLQGVKDTDTLLAATIEDIKFYINSQPRLDINIIAWFMINTQENALGTGTVNKNHGLETPGSIVYERTQGVHIVQLANLYENQSIIIVLDGEHQFVYSILWLGSELKLTVKFFTHAEGLSIDTPTGYVIDPASLKPNTIVVRTSDANEVRDMLLEQVKSNIEQTKAVNKVSKLIKKYLDYYISATKY